MVAGDGPAPGPGTMDYQPHFHAWLYPRAAADPRRGTAFLDHGMACSQDAAEAAAAGLREVLPAAWG